LGSKTIQDDWKHLVLSECVRRRGTMIFMSHDMYRGALAEELILVDRIQPPLEGFSSISALSYREPEPIAMVRPDGKSNTPANIELQRTANNKYLASIARLRLGECVSRQEPMKSRALFDTAIGSPAELSALQSFQGAISSCIVAGETVAFDRMTLRGVIAVGLYRLANASQSSGVSH